MQVVELAHAADPDQRHLCVDGAGERRVTVWIQRRGDLIHPLRHVQNVPCPPA
jgi:hypothetical protein